jgi:hypothetical protein
MISWFANQSEVIAEISGPNYGSRFYFPLISEKENVMRYRIYKTSAVLPNAIIPIAKSTHNYLLYPIGYDRTFGKLFDDYETHNFIDWGIDKIAHYILYFCIFLSLFSSLFLLYVLIVSENSENVIKEA